MTQNERVREIRKSLGMTMDTFGEKIGVGKTAISKIENGERNVTDQMAKSICREFHVSEDWLRTGEGEMFIELDPEDELMEWAGRVLASEPEDFRRRFVKMLSQLTDDQWKILEEKCLEVAGIVKDND